MPDEDMQPNDDPNVYSEQGAAKMVEDDEMEPWEGGFMEGARMDGQLGKCAGCGDMLTEKNTLEKKTVEEGEEELHRFCSQHCLEKWEEKHAE